jgi:tRNA dimethylallyltransferase
LAAASAVPAIVGPTAAGKSALAMWLAGRYPLVVISADSRQVYRRFDIGTAKPSPAERAAVPHHGIDVAEPTERCSAFWWAATASGWIREANSAGRTPVVVGGSGLYVRALFETSFEEPELPGPRRARLQQFFATFTVPELRRWCQAVDPARAHLGRTQLLRALEVALLSGRRLSVLHVTQRRQPSCSPRYLVVDPGRALGDRIAARTRNMLAAGWVDEVRSLAATLPANAPAWKSTGYRVVRAFAEGLLTERQLLEQVVVETRQYAKRQRTWFRHQLRETPLVRVDPTAPGWQEVVDQWWNRERPA